MNTIIAKAGVDDDRMYEQAAEILKRGGLGTSAAACARISPKR